MQVANHEFSEFCVCACPNKLGPHEGGLHYTFRIWQHGDKWVIVWLQCSSDLTVIVPFKLRNSLELACKHMHKHT